MRSDTPVLPQLLKLPEVRDAVKMAKPTIYRAIRRGDFPAPVKLGARASAWRSDEVYAWIESRSNARASGK